MVRVVVMFVGVFFACVSAAMAADTEEPLRSIAEIQSLPLDELRRGREVAFRGVVTALIGGVKVVQQDDHGIFLSITGAEIDDVRTPREEPATIAVGQLVDLEGHAIAGGWKPVVKARRIRIIDEVELPEPAPLDLARLYSGIDSGRRIVATGIVHRVDGGSLILETGTRRLVIELPPELCADRNSLAARLVDAEVRLVGVGRAYFNTRGEFLAPALTVARAVDLAVLEPPPTDAFAVPYVPLDSIARYRGTIVGGHRIRVAGTVSYAVPGTLYLQEAEGGVRIDLAEAAEAGCALGDRVEAVGFPDVSRRIGGLTAAVARRIAAGTPPEPRPLQPSAIARINREHEREATIASPGSFDGCLVRAVARLDSVSATPQGTVLALFENDTPFLAVLPRSATAALPGIAPGSELAITGIVRIDRSGPLDDLTISNPTLEQLTLLVRDAADITVLRLPPWWTPRRLAMAGVGVAALGAAAGAWIAALRREVRRQTAAAVAGEQARRDAAIEYEVTLRERNRLASNLHDTILQTVTGIGYQLRACTVTTRGFAGGDPDEDADAPTAAAKLTDQLEMAGRMVEHATTQLRGTVWSLKSLAGDGRPLSVAIRDAAGRAGGHATQVAVAVDPAAERLPELVAGNLLLLVQEAIHNAVHHGEPNRIDVTVAMATPRGPVTATIHDDGPGFELEHHPGPAEGHFGLSGMRERAERLGGTFAIDSSPGAGTTVTAVVPVDSRPDMNIHPLVDRTPPPPRESRRCGESAAATPTPGS